MNSPLNMNTPEEVLPYVPDWAREPGQRRPVSENRYDAFHDEENPSYRQMAQMFAPQPAQSRQANPAMTMLLRFGAVIGLASIAIAIFVGYIASHPDKTAVATKIEAAPVAKSAAPLNPTATPEPLTTMQSDPAPVPVQASSPPPEQPAAPPVQTTSTPASPAKSEPPAPVVPPAPKLSESELASLMGRGHRFVETGDFSSARPVYRRAAEAGYSDAALALGGTYDPRTLAERGAVGISSDIAQARYWYERARDLGSLEAPTRLARLPPH